MRESRRRKLKIGLACFIGLIILVSLALYVCTRPAVIKAVVLPRVEQATGLAIDWEQMTFAPFSRIELRGVKVRTDDEMVVDAAYVKCDYKFMQLLKQKLTVDELRLEDAAIKLKQRKDGTWRLMQRPETRRDTASQKQKEADASAKTPDKTASFVERFTPSLEKMHCRNIAVEVERELSEEKTAVYRLENFDMNARNIAAGAKASIDWEGSIYAEQADSVQIREGRIKGSIRTELTPRFLPAVVRGSMQADQLTGQIGGTPLAGRNLSVEVQIDAVADDDTKWNISNLSVVAQKKDRREFACNVTGSAGIAPYALDARLKVTTLEPALINAIAAFQEEDWRLRNLSFTADTAIGVRAGRDVTCTGTVNARDMQMEHDAIPLSADDSFDMALSYDLAVNTKDSTVSVQQLEGSIADAERDLLRMQLLQPVNFSYTDGNQRGQGRLKLSLHDLSIKRWAPLFRFIPAAVLVHDGQFYGDVVAQMSGKGRSMTAQGTLGIKNLAVQYQDISVHDVDLTQTFDAVITNFNKLELSECETDVTHSGDTVVRLVCDKGQVTMNDLSGTLTYRAEDISETCLDLIPVKTAQRVPITELDAGLSGNIDFQLSATEARRIDATGAVNINQIRMATSTETQGDVPPLAAEVAYNVNLENFDLLTVKNLETSLSRLSSGSEELLLQMELTGTSPLKLEQGRSELALRVASVDGTAIEKLVEKSTPFFKRDDATPQKRSDQKAQDKPEDRNVIDDLDLRLDFRVDEATYRQLLLKNGKGRVICQDGSIVLTPTVMQINGGDVEVQGHADVSNESVVCSYKTTLNDLPLAPFMQSFAAVPIRMDGQLQTLRTSGESQGATMTELVRRLKMRTDARLSNMSLNVGAADAASIPGLNILMVPLQVVASLPAGAVRDKLDPKLVKLSQEAAQALRGERPIRFSEGELALQMQAGKMHLRDCRFTGDVIDNIEINGSVDLLNSSLTRDEMTWKKMAPALNLVLNFGVLDNAVSIPVQGRLDQPEWSAQGIMKNMLRKYGEDLVRGALQQLQDGEDVDLGDLLKGALQGKKDKQKEESSEEPPKQDEGDSRLDMFQRLLKEID